MEFDEYFSVNNVKEVFYLKLKDSNIVGVDGTNAKAFKKDIDNQAEVIARKCSEGTYQFTRFKEKLISKGARSKPRQISIPTIRDSLVLRILCNFLTDKFTTLQIKPPHLHIKDIQKILHRSNSEDVFLRLDVKEFYPSIDQTILKKKLKLSGIPDIAIKLIIAAITNQTGIRKSLPINRNVPQRLSISNIRALINCVIETITNRSEIKNPPKNCGVPQGLSISNILSAIYFLEIDEKLTNRRHYFRYVDDILFICKATEYETLYEETKNLLYSELKLTVHKLNTDKSMMRPISKGIDYLGFHITNKHLKVREQSYRRVFNSIVNLVTLYARNYKNYSEGDSRDLFRERFLWKMNLRITGCRLDEKPIGWMFFFRQTQDMQQIKRLDAFVTKIFRERGLSEYRSRVRRFTRIYYEIQRKHNRVNHIPDFNNFTRDKKIEVMAMLAGKSQKIFENFSNEEIDERFLYIIRREVRQMERETVNFTDEYR